MNNPNDDSIAIVNETEDVSPESRHAWLIWKKLTDFSEFLWDAYEHDFLTLAASEPPACRSQGEGWPPKKYRVDNPPF